jgi:hypothetical protein
MKFFAAAIAISVMAVVGYAAYLLYGLSHYL